MVQIQQCASTCQITKHTGKSQTYNIPYKWYRSGQCLWTMIGTKEARVFKRLNNDLGQLCKGKPNTNPYSCHWYLMKMRVFFHKQSPFELSSHSFQVIMFHTQPIHSKFLESNPPWITGKKKKNIHDSSLTPENHPMSVRYETLVWSVVLSFRMGWHLPLFILKGTLKGTFASAKISALHAWLQPTRLSCLLPWL